MCTVKGGKNGSNTFGEGWGTFPPTPPKGRIWGDLGGEAAGGDDLLLLWSGRSEGKKGRVGEQRPARALDIGLVAPARMAYRPEPRLCQTATSTSDDCPSPTAPRCAFASAACPLSSPLIDLQEQSITASFSSEIPATTVSSRRK